MVNRIRLLILCVFLLGIPTKAQNDGLTGKDITFIIKLAIALIKTNIQRIANAPILKNNTFVIPSTIGEGMLQLSDVYIYGLKDILLTSDVKNDKDFKGYSRSIIRVGAILETLGVTGKYDADIAISDEIPIYGIGEFRLGVLRVNFDLQVNLTIETKQNIYVDDLTIQLTFNEDKAAISGFWKNPDGDKIAMDILNVLEIELCTAYTLANTWITSSVGAILQYIINKYLSHENVTTLNITDGFVASNQRYNLEKNLKTFMEDYNILDFNTHFLNNDMMLLYSDIYQYFIAILNDKGVLDIF